MNLGCLLDWTIGPTNGGLTRILCSSLLSQHFIYMFFYLILILLYYNYHPIQVARSNRVNFQTFFDLMQQSAEDLDLMDLEDAMLDNMLPLVILKTFLNDFLVGVSRMQVGASAAVKRSSRLEEQKEMKEIET